LLMYAQTKCYRCGQDVQADDRFCPQCGIRNPQRPSHLSQKQGLLALVVTFASVLVTVMAKTLDVSLLVALFNLGVLLPAIISLCLAVYLVMKQRSAGPLSLIPFNPAIALLVTLVWFSLSMLLASDPGEHLITIIIWYVLTLGLLLAWLAVFVAAIQTLEASAWSVVRRAVWVAVYVAPLPVAVYLVMLLAGQEKLTLRARFEVSESAFERAVIERQQTSHRVGLFQVSMIEDVEHCVLLETGGAALGDGFAYCPDGRRPSRAMRDSPPDITMSPMNGDWEGADWWTYEVAEDSYLGPR
jgi:hypothetical protein